MNKPLTSPSLSNKLDTELDDHSQEQRLKSQINSTVSEANSSNETTSTAKYNNHQQINPESIKNVSINENGETNGKEEVNCDDNLSKTMSKNSDHYFNNKRPSFSSTSSSSALSGKSPSSPVTTAAFSMDNESKLLNTVNSVFNEYLCNDDNENNDISYETMPHFISSDEEDENENDNEKPN